MGDRLLGQKGDINSKTLEKYSQRIPEYGTVPSSSIIKPYSQVVEPYTKGELDPAALAAVERGEIVEKTPDTALKRFNSISDVNPTIYDAFLNTRNALPQRADKNQATLRNLSNSSYAQVVSQEPKVTFNDLVTVAYIPLEGKGRRTDKLKGYRTEEEQIATLQDLAENFSSCLVAQVNRLLQNPLALDDGLYLKYIYVPLQGLQCDSFYFHRILQSLSEPYYSTLLLQK